MQQSNQYSESTFDIDIRFFKAITFAQENKEIFYIKNKKRTRGLQIFTHNSSNRSEFSFIFNIIYSM